MENAKKFHIIMNEKDHRQLKSLAAADGVTIGKAIEIILDFVLSRAKRRQVEIADLDFDFERTPLHLGLLDERSFKMITNISREQAVQDSAAAVNLHG